MSCHRYTTVEGEKRRFFQVQGDLLKGASSLASLADFCDEEYEAQLTAESRHAVFQKIKTATIQALGAVAHQINESATAVLGVVDVVSESVGFVQSGVTLLNLRVDMHREKVGKREATQICVSRQRRTHRKMKVPKRVQVAVYPGHKALAADVLDNVGRGVTGGRRGSLLISSLGGSNPTTTNESPYALTMRNVTVSVESTKSKVQKSPSTGSKWKLKHKGSEKKPKSELPPTPTSARPQLELPTAQSALGRARSASLNDVDQLRTDTQGRLNSPVLTEPPSDTDGDIYTVVNMRQRKPSSRSIMTPQEHSLMLPGLLDRGRSKSLGCVANCASGEGDSLYSNWPAIQKENLRQIHSSAALPAPPTGPPPPDGTSIVFCDRRGSVASSASGEEFYGEEAIEYDTVLYDAVLPTDPYTGTSAVGDIMPACSPSPPVPPSPNRSPAHLVRTSPVFNGSADDHIYTPVPLKSRSKSPAPAWVPAHYMGMAVALYNFVPIDDGQLQLTQGEKIYLLSKLATDHKWYVAMNGDGEKGIVPCRYVHFAFHDEEDIEEFEEPMIDPLQV